MFELKSEIWDCEMDMGWEDLAVYFKRVTEIYIGNLKYCADHGLSNETSRLINRLSCEKYLNIVELVTNDMSDSICFLTEDIDNQSVSGLRLKQWIILGTITEVTLQMFLTIYLSDFENSHWQQWSDFATEDTKSAIANVVKQLVDNGVIEQEQGKSIKKAVKKEIDLHIKPHALEKIMLDEVIAFYQKQNILDEDDIFILRIIQSNRNGIHAYMGREMGTWMDLQNAIRHMGAIIELLTSKLPVAMDELDE